VNPVAVTDAPMKVIACLVYPGVMSLDVTGPMQVFASANVELIRQGLAPIYELQLLGESVGPVATSAGLKLHADASWLSIDCTRLDTVLLPGGSSDAEQCANTALLAWLQTAAAQVRRLGSVCSGALMLASAGLLDGLIATTHWDDVEALQAFANVQVQGDRLHTYDPSNRDGHSHIFTSAGVTAGIDLALALIEADLGRPLALAVARRLVLFLKRPGGQTQFSPHLAHCNGATSRLTVLLEWIAANLHTDLSLEAMAQKANMAPRTLYRVFVAELDITPARHVERVRLEAARAMIQGGQLSLQTVARLCGYGHAENLRRSFQKMLGVSPQGYAQRFGQ
jgi:transcriptional regulator GlxA family with amidase domain